MSTRNKYDLPNLSLRYICGDSLLFVVLKTSNNGAACGGCFSFPTIFPLPQLPYTPHFALGSCFYFRSICFCAVAAVVDVAASAGNVVGGVADTVDTAVDVVAVDIVVDVAVDICSANEVVGNVDNVEDDVEP